VISRRRRSFEEPAWFFDHIDRCLIFDNSTGEPKPLARKMRGELIVVGGLPSDLRDILTGAGIQISDI